MPKKYDTFWWKLPDLRAQEILDAKKIVTEATGQITKNTSNFNSLLAYSEPNENEIYIFNHTKIVTYFCNPMILLEKFLWRRICTL